MVLLVFYARIQVIKKLEEILKKTFLSILAASAILMLTSCASTGKTKNEPGAPDSSILIGKMAVEFRGYDENFNGLHTKDLRVTVKEQESGKTWQVYTNNEGLFLVPKAKTNYHYSITEVYFLVNEGSTISWCTMPLQSPVMTCKADYAGILSNIVIKLQKDNGGFWFEKNDPADVKASFKNTYPESEWNDYPFLYLN